jgi:hypothetical protein
MVAVTKEHLDKLLDAFVPLMKFGLQEQDISVPVSPNCMATVRFSGTPSRGAIRNLCETLKMLEPHFTESEEEVFTKEAFKRLSLEALELAASTPKEQP